jgi:hypothetical protein
VNQHLHQRQHRRDGSNLAAIDRFEEGLNDRKISGMLFDEVDERGRIQSNDTTTQAVYPPYEERSLRT